LFKYSNSTSLHFYTGWLEKLPTFVSFPSYQNCIKSKDIVGKVLSWLKWWFWFWNRLKNVASRTPWVRGDLLIFENVFIANLLFSTLNNIIYFSPIFINYRLCRFQNFFQNDNISYGSGMTRKWGNTEYFVKWKIPLFNPNFNK